MVLILHIHEIIYISLKLIIPSESRRKAPGREVYNPVTREALVFPTSIATPAWFSLCYKSVEFGLYPPRLAYKSSSIFFHECEAGAVYVDFLCFLWQKRARERELDLFPLQKKALRPCLHGVGDPGLVGLVSFVFTLWGTQNKRNLPH